MTAEFAVATVRGPSGAAPDVTVQRSQDGWTVVEDLTGTWQPGSWHFEASVTVTRPMRLVPADAIVLDRELHDLAAILTALQRSIEDNDYAAPLQAIAAQLEPPAPPKPTEPTGLGAVVRDIDGRTGTRPTAPNRRRRSDVVQGR